MKSKLAVVTGYVKIPNHPRSDEEYQRLGAKLLEITAAPVHVLRHGLDRCWLTPPVKDLAVTHATGDNPRKNTLAYHIVQHQKTKWLVDVSEMDHAADVLVWIDYGVFSQPGITVDVIDAFLLRVAAAEEDKICIPGAWERQAISWPNEPYWRFCGSSMIMPAVDARTFHEAVRSVTLERIATNNFVTWEINDWAAVERQGTPPIRWYLGDHNESQFTNYGKHR